MDILAGALGLVGFFLVGRKLRIGFLCHIVSSGCWITTSFLGAVHGRPIFGLTAAAIISVAINVWNFWFWGRK